MNEFLNLATHLKLWPMLAYIIITSNSTKTIGNFLVYDEVLASEGILGLTKYNCDPTKSPYQRA